MKKMPVRIKKIPKDEEKLDDNFYDIDTIQEMLDNDELDSVESGFMQGYLQAGS